MFMRHGHETLELGLDVIFKGDLEARTKEILRLRRAEVACGAFTVDVA